MKMRKRVRAIVSAALISAMMMSMGMSAFAANTPVNGSADAVEVAKYLVMDDNANVPNVTFEYTIKAGTAVPANLNSRLPEVKAGVGNPSISSTVFAVGDTTSKEAKGVLTLNSNEKYAEQSAKVDFSTVVFNEPGIYRYEITENALTDKAEFDIDTSTLYLDVYVTSDSEGILSVARYILHKTIEVANTDGTFTNGDEKTTGFVNKYATKDLELKKVVEGNQGDRNKAFNFNISITDATAGTKYNLLASPSNAVGVESVVADTDGTVSFNASLPHDGSVKVLGLTQGTKYTIIEEDYANEGYTTTNNKGDGLSTGKKAVSDDNSVIFTNTKTVTTPTGIIMSFAPYILILALAGVFAVMFLRKKKEEF